MKLRSFSLIMLTFVALFSLVFLHSANGNWLADNDDSYEGLNVYEMALECNDALSECERHFSGHLSIEGLPFKSIEHVLKYTKDPYTLEYDSKVATVDLNASVNQDDPLEKFKVCSEITEDKVVPVIGLYHGKWNLCLENDFSSLTVPADCPVPVAVSKIVGALNNEKLMGQQVLYCMPA